MAGTFGFCEQMPVANTSCFETALYRPVGVWSVISHFALDGLYFVDWISAELIIVRLDVST